MPGELGTEPVPRSCWPAPYDANPSPASAWEGFAFVGAHDPLSLTGGTARSRTHIDPIRRPIDAPRGLAPTLFAARGLQRHGSSIGGCAVARHPCCKFDRGRCWGGG